MLSYFIDKWRLSRCFEPCDGGFLYRSRPTDEAILVTADERRQMFVQHRKSFWTTHALLLFGALVTITLIVCVLIAIDAPESAGSALGYSIAAFLVPVTFIVNRRISRKTEDVLGDRPAVKPARTWTQIQDERLAKTAWWRILSGGFLFGLLAWVSLPSSTSALWIWAIWSAYFGFFFAMWLRSVWRKANGANLV